jgi:hypothetical protein
MIRNVISIALGGAALALAAPSIAAPGGGHGGGPSAAGVGARAGSQGPVNASPNGVLHSSPNSVLHDTTTTPTVNTNVKANSQGVLHANPNGISHSSSSSALARGAVASTALPGLTTGLTVNNSSGASIGTVSQIITGTDGSIRAVVVTSPTGQTTRLLPNTLTISGGVVTTTGG